MALSFRHTTEYLAGKSSRIRFAFRRFLGRCWFALKLARTEERWSSLRPVICATIVIYSSPLERLAAAFARLRSRLPGFAFRINLDSVKDCVKDWPLHFLNSVKAGMSRATKSSLGRNRTGRYEQVGPVHTGLRQTRSNQGRKSPGGKGGKSKKGQAAGRQVCVPLGFGFVVRVNIKLNLERVPRQIFAPFTTYRQQAVSFLLVFAIVLTSFIFYPGNSALGATYTFTQTDWSGGAETHADPVTNPYAVHPTNQSNWTKYYSKDAGTAASTELTISPTSATSTQTSDTDFNAGTHSTTVTSGTGASADVVLEALWACGDNVTFTYRGVEVTYGTVASEGECWLDRNLGASQVATAYNNSAAYGDLFQWGRLDDGHQSRTSGTTSTNSSTDTPGHSNLITEASSPYDWRVPQNDNLWQGDGGTNDVCPAGWRVATEAEWETERLSWSSNNYNGAFASPLKLTAGGYRGFSDASLGDVGSSGFYWSSTVAGTSSRYLRFNNGDAFGSSFYRAFGFSVRCIKDVASVSYQSSGTFTSSAIDTGQASDFTTLDFTATTPANTTLTVDVRAGNVAVPDGTWTAWQTGISNGGSTSALNGNRYVQYRANLATTDTAVTPSLSDITFNYQYYAAGDHTLTGSPYDASDAANVVASLAWTETLNSGDVRFQIRTAPDNAGAPGVWTAWCGPDDGVGGSCDSGTYFTNPAGTETVDDILTDGTNDQWVQIKAFLTRGDGVSTPTLSDLTLTYVVNAPPAFDTDSTTASQASTGEVDISFAIKDQDTTLGSTTANYITPAKADDSSGYEYSLNNGSTWSNITLANITYGSAPVGGNITDIDINGLTDLKVLAGSYLTYTLEWDAATQLGATYAAQAMVRLTINDNEAANATATQSSSAFVLDTTSPTLGTPTGGGSGVNVNQNSLTAQGNDKTSSTSVTLNLSASDDTTLQMILSESSDFTGASYEAYASTKAFTLSSGDGTKTVYARFRDAKGNISSTASDTITLDSTAPAIPANVQIQDVSNAATSEFRMFVMWGAIADPGDFVSYTLQYSTASEDGFQTLSTITNRTTNYSVHTGLTQGVTYYYKLRDTDDISNTSSWSSTVSLEAGSNPADNIDPTISSITEGTPTSSAVTITWTTDESANATVLYSTDTAYDSSQGVSTYGTSHSVTVKGLSAGTAYNYKVRSCDPSSNCTTSSADSFTTASADSTAPTISNITVASTAEKSATVTWTTNESASSFVEYSTTNGFSSGTLFGSNALTTSHSVTLPSVLSSGTQYYFKVRSTDGAGNEQTSSQSTFTTDADSSDTTAPTISSISSGTPGEHTATITWTTDEASSSFVEFGETTSYGRTAGSYALATSHSVALPQDLYAATTYNYRVRSTDEAGNEKVSANNTLTTAVSSNDSTPPVISSISLGEPTATSLTVTWTTDELATSFLEYSKDTTSYDLSQGSPVLATSHSITLVGLTPNTQYYLRVTSTDGSQNTRRDDNSSNGYAFTTASSNSTPPVINENTVAITGVTTNTATITWTTDKSSDSFVEFGFDTAYGRTAGQYDAVTSHSVSLPQDLLGDITYHFRVRSTDSDNNEAVSQDYTFTTPASSAVDLAEDSTAPTISSVTAGLISYNSVVITWVTSEQATSQVFYGLDTNYGSSSTEDTTKTIQHAVTISGLSASTTYTYKVVSEDASGNSTTKDNGGSGYAFTTPAETSDTTAPGISSVSAGSITLTAATITWTTDEGASSIVEYGTAADALNTAAGSATESVTSHSVSLSNLSSGTTYYYQVISIDSQGNSRTDNNSSSYYTFTTTGDTTAPTISSVTEALIGQTGATITWTTDESSTSQVNYGTTVSLGNSTTQDATLTAQHAVTLTGLSANTSTYYEVVSEDASGNSATGDNGGSKYQFTTASEPAPGSGGGMSASSDTTVPFLSKVEIKNITQTTANVAWRTDEIATSFVRYGTNKDKLDEINGSHKKTLDHEVALKNLSPSTTHFFVIESADTAGNLAISKTYSFDTLKAGELEEAASAESSGEPKEEGQEEGGETAPEASGTAAVRALEVEIEGGVGVSELAQRASRGFIERFLEAFTSNPELANVSESSFVSSASEAASRIVAPPVISGSDVSVQAGTRSALIRWVTDKKANSLIAFAPATLYDGSKADPYQIVSGNPDEQVTNHAVTLTGLEPGTLYHYQIRSRGVLGPVASLEDRTFTTQSLTPEIVDVSFKEIGESTASLSWATSLPTRTILQVTNAQTGEARVETDNNYLKEHSFTLENLLPATPYSLSLTAEDEEGNTSESSLLPFSTFLSKEPPKITQVRMTSTLVQDRADTVQTIISWKTSKPADTSLQYAEGTGPNLSQTITGDRSLTLDHLVITTAFRPGQVYRFQAASKDAGGTLSLSTVHTLLTPKPRASVVDLIIGNFGKTFEFLRRPN